MSNIKVGDKFGRWTVISGPLMKHTQKHDYRAHLCLCECGTKRQVLAQSLRREVSKSCGCLHKEIISKQMSGTNHPMYKHGHCKKGQRSKEWRTWNAMIRRCTYESMDDYERYGGRGITICEQWRNSFEQFLSDVGQAPSHKHSLDRIDNEGNYEPDNVRWTTNSEQVKNSRRARLITYQGRTMNLCDWSEETGIKRTTIQMRLDRCGWSVHDALTKPPQRRRK